MRFPDRFPFMKLVFDLILRDKNSLDTGMLPIIPYVMHNPNYFFNDIIETNAELSVEPLPLDAFESTLLIP
jgi:hypothetical protein